jgi:hypothetical protein
MEKYKSKFGLEIVLFIGIILGFVSIQLVMHHAWPGLIVIAGVILFSIYLFSSICYIIDDKNLIINCGFSIKMKIQINRITKIKETYNPLSSPAASINRLAIYYNKAGYILISPKEKIKFINRLIEINPNIEVTLRKSKQNTSR